jgi:hypothetical protein
MALSRFRDSDNMLGQNVGSGTEAAFVPAVMLVDSAGTEIPSGGTAVGASSGNKANASAAAAMPAVVGKTNYITSADITFSGATAASVVIATITGLLGGTQSAIVSVPAGATVGGTPLCLKFDPPFPASAANTAITVTLPALGSGNTNACVNVRGILK